MFGIETSAVIRGLPTLTLVISCWFHRYSYRAMALFRCSSSGVLAKLFAMSPVAFGRQSAVNTIGVCVVVGVVAAAALACASVASSSLFSVEFAGELGAVGGSYMFLVLSYLV